ncbi:MAG TPA: glycoside hydrolase family 57 protein [Terriglobales bacterium]|nr:glycoside hydrolase family 57 protein [Terriglobales bacterium]
MPIIRIAFLWHQHQPFYKDLITGEYRLPWVRLHALKDYYGMVKLLDEFPGVHQTFNLVPSLIWQIQEYVSGNARDPFLTVASKAAADLNMEQRRFALAYLFQANPSRMIGRYPRYQELFHRFEVAGHNPEKALDSFQTQDIADLQVLSQIAWFDEYFLKEPEVARLIAKGRDYSPEDQQMVLEWQRRILAAVLPAHEQAASKGSIELSTSPFYHPILPLICDSNQGAVSVPGLPLPTRFRRPDDAREQIKRGLDLHEKVFGKRPVGLWPSEGSVSEEAVAIAAELGLKWMATDEGVLGRTIDVAFDRSNEGRLRPEQAVQLYTPYQYRKGSTKMKMIFRDHTLSDLIGFVYSGMPAVEAANHFIRSIKDCAKPVLDKGHDAFIPIILDGENAWEFYHESGREFLRRVYDAIQHDPSMQALTMSEALKEHKSPPVLENLVPGSWINANFNVWIGAPEDNKAWDYLNEARAFYDRAAANADPEKAKLAFEELLIAEGSDWNWWYGPEHHSANDRDFDELYRKHLSNVYQLLGAEVPLYLAQPIAAGAVRPVYSPQTAYIRPRIGTGVIRYFDWLGAAIYNADRHTSAMHGKQFLLDALYAGVDENNLYGRLDFCEMPTGPVQLNVNIDIQSKGQVHSGWRLMAELDKSVQRWELRDTDSDKIVLKSEDQPNGMQVTMTRTFEFKMPLTALRAEQGSSIHLRFSLWREGLPIDALPVEGAVQLHVVSEEELQSELYNYSVSS